MTANVARSEEEAEIQEQTGEAVIAIEEDNTLIGEEARVESVAEDRSGKDADLHPIAEESDDKGADDDAGAIDAPQDGPEDD